MFAGTLGPATIIGTVPHFDDSTKLRHAHDVSYLDLPKPLALAHRGFSVGGDENTMASFQRAIDLGYRYLETDVQASADGVAVAFHDSRLDRVTDSIGAIAAQRMAAIRNARVAGREPIPTLAEVLDRWPNTRVNIDVKADNAVGPTIDAIQQCGAIDRVCIAAFSTARISALRHALGPRLCSALGPRENLALTLRRHSAQNPRHPDSGRCAQVPHRLGPVKTLSSRFIRAAHGNGVDVHAWTVNSRAEMINLLDLGVDGIITDRADVLRTLLIERRQW